MRPLRIMLEAFGPYLKPVEIDFTELNAASLFLICGPTGGGKTSILDAMCFALYCRATGGKRDFKSMRNASAGYEADTKVEFDFLLGDASYRFCRTLHMHKNRSTKQYEPRDTHACYQHTEEGLSLLESRNETAVRKKAEELLHLTCEQFSQVIVLPQGDFLRLLRANSKEKAAIFETLFSSELWRGVMETASGKTRALEAQRRKQQTIKDSLLEQAGAESTEQLQSREAGAVKQAAACRKENSLLGKQYEETLSAVSLHEAYYRAKQAAEQAAAAHKAADEKLAAAVLHFKKQENKKEQAEKARAASVSIREEISRLNTELARFEALAGINRRIKEKKADLSSLQIALLAKQKKLQQNEESLKSGKNFLENAQRYADTIPALLEQKNKLKESLGAYQEFLRLQTAVTEAESARQKLQAEFVRLQTLSRVLTEKLALQEQHLRDNSAANLAQFLTPGAPCPVCGSFEHPAPCRIPGASPLSAEEIKSLRKQEKEARESFLRIETALESQEEEVKKTKQLASQQQLACSSFWETRDNLAQSLQNAVDKLDLAKKSAEKLEPANKRLQELAAENTMLKTDENTLNIKITALRAEIDTELKNAADAEKGLSYETADALKAVLQAKNAESGKLLLLAEQYSKIYHDARQTVSEADAVLQTAKKSVQETGRQLTDAASKIDAAKLQDLQVLRASAETVKQALIKNTELLGKADTELSFIQNSLSSVKKLDADASKLDADYQKAARLSHLIAGSNPMKTPILQYVLSIMLDQILVSANRFLSTLSRGRYAFTRIKEHRGGNAYGGLDMEIIDGASMTARSIETLSGGEQFLASLSLALGLSDMVQNYSSAVQMDALFIDEGFGSLDSDTLDTAMKALGMIQAGGRTVGIISHVFELKSRISARVEITKDTAGYASVQVKI